MKKYLILILTLAGLLSPAFAYAAVAAPWEYSNGFVEPTQALWATALKFPYFTATSTATSTMAGGLDMATGCFAINHVCLGTGAGTITNIATSKGLVGGPITTSGTLTALNQQASYIVSTTTASGDYTDIQTAISALPSTAGLIHVKCGTYTITTPITIAANNVVIEGEGNCTKVQFSSSNASTTFSDSAPATQRTGIVIKDLEIDQTGTAGTGVGIDMSGFAISRLENVWIDNVKGGILSDNSLTDYNTYSNLRIGATSTASWGMKFTNQSNSNAVYKARIITGSTTEGVIWNGAIANLASGVDVETGGTIAFDVQTGANSTVIQNGYSEGNGIGLKLASNVRDVQFLGGNLSSATNTEIVDGGAVGLTVNTQKDSVATNFYSGGATVAFGNISPLKFFEIGATSSGATAGYLRVESPSTAASVFDLFRQGTVGWGFAAGGASAGDLNITHNVSGNPSDANIKTASVFTIGDAAPNNIGIGTTSPNWKLSVSGAVAAANFIGTTTAISSLAGGLDIGTTTGGEILNIDNTANSGFTTANLWNNNVNGVFYADGTDGLVGIGAHSNHTLDLLTNNAEAAQLYTLSGQTNIFQVDAPSGNPLEADMATVLTTSAGNRRFVDWDLENFPTDAMASIVIAKQGTGTLLPFGIRFWNQDAGTVADTGVWTYLTDPSGVSAIGAFATSTGANTAARYNKTTVLQVASTSATTLFSTASANAASTGWTPNFVILGTGNVGIGTTTPGALLSVAGNTLIGGNFTATGTTIKLTGLTASRPLYVDSTGLVGSAGSGTSGNCVQWAANNTFGDAGAACGSGSSVYPFAPFSIYGTTSSATSSSLRSAGVFFASSTVATSTFDGGALLAVLAGNVGIGTSSPSQKLSVNGNGLFNGNLILGGSQWTAEASSTQSNSLTFTSSGLTTPNVVFQTTGNVGIGTTTPNASLDVNGGIDIENGNSLVLRSTTYSTASTINISSGGLVSTTHQWSFDSGGITSVGDIVTSGTGNIKALGRLQDSSLTIDPIGSNTNIPTGWNVMVNNNTNGNASSTGIGFSVSTAGLTTAMGAGIMFQRLGSNSFGNLLFYTSSSSNQLTPYFEIDQFGHVGFGGALPGTAVSTCGTSPVIKGNDTAGQIKIGTGATSACTVTFANAYTNPPMVFLQLQAPLATATVVVPTQITTTGFIITASAANFGGATTTYFTVGSTTLPVTVGTVKPSL